MSCNIFPLDAVEEFEERYTGVDDFTGKNVINYLQAEFPWSLKRFSWKGKGNLLEEYVLIILWLIYIYFITFQRCKHQEELRNKNKNMNKTVKKLLYLNKT